MLVMLLLVVVVLVVLVVAAATATAAVAAVVAAAVATAVNPTMYDLEPGADTASKGLSVGDHIAAAHAC